MMHYGEPAQVLKDRNGLEWTLERVNATTDGSVNVYYDFIFYRNPRPDITENLVVSGQPKTIQNTLFLIFGDVAELMLPSPKREKELSGPKIIKELS